MHIIAVQEQENKSQRIHAHVDYATITFPIASMQCIDSVMSFLVKERDEWCCLNERVCVANHKFFENAIKSVKNLQGGYSLPGEGGYDQKGELMLQLSGKYWEEYSVVDQWRLIRGIKHAFNGRFTRIDLAIDDLENNVIPVEQMREARNSGNVKGFRKWREVISGCIDGEVARTDYYGSRESEKLIRIYKHDNEFFRMEGEYRSARAEAIVSILCGIERGSYEERSPSEFDYLLQQVMASIVVGTIDFVDRWKNSEFIDDSAKCKRLAFYQEFIDKIGGSIKVSSPKKERSLSRTLAWMKRQVMPTLMAIRHGLRPEKWAEWLRDIGSGVKERENSYHRMIEACVRNNSREAWGFD